jgi:predicted ATP-grasp superfamily ATP-dependent carboligase
MVGDMTTGDRIEEQSFCYDPDFPPDVAEGKPLASIAAKPHSDPAVRRMLRKCAELVARADRSA